jgi:glycerate 2-kinase
MTSSGITDFGDVASSVILAVMDKFRGTATARELNDAVARPAFNRGWVMDLQPMSDGGEGFRDAFDGEEMVLEVPGPLGSPVRATIIMTSSSTGRLAVLEVAEAVGRHLLVSPTPEEALRASSAGVGHLILAAIAKGADELLIGCGGSATSDGGFGCYEVLMESGGLSIPVTAATDVTARFLGARRYAEQKGVASSDMDLLDRRLQGARDLYRSEQGVDVELFDRTGAAGGVPGALAALGADLTSGFDAVAHAVDLDQRIERSALVVTGEGRFDEGSLEGKVTVGIAQLVDGRVPVLVVCGSLDEGAAQEFIHRFPTTKVVSLAERFGIERAMNDVRACVEEVVGDEVGVRF